MGSIIPLRRERQFVNKINEIKLWSFISLERTDRGGILYIDSVAASAPWEAIENWAEDVFLGSEEYLDEGEVEFPLRIAWLSRAWRSPVIRSYNALEMGLGIPPIDITKMEVQLALKSKDDDVTISAIVEVRLKEMYPGRMDLPDFERCIRLREHHFPSVIMRKHRVAVSAWESENMRSAEGLFL